MKSFTRLSITKFCYPATELAYNTYTGTQTNWSFESGTDSELRLGDTPGEAQVATNINLRNGLPARRSGLEPATRFPQYVLRYEEGKVSFSRARRSSGLRPAKREWTSPSYKCTRKSQASFSYLLRARQAIQRVIEAHNTSIRIVVVIKVLVQSIFS